MYSQASSRNSSLQLGEKTLSWTIFHIQIQIQQKEDNEPETEKVSETFNILFKHWKRNVLWKVEKDDKNSFYASQNSPRHVANEKVFICTLKRVFKKFRT